MKKHWTVWLAALLLTAILSVSGTVGLSSVIKAEGEDAPKTIESLVADAVVTDEFVYYGEPVVSSAKVRYSDGSQGDEPIVWENLNANTLNTNFNMVEVRGKVKGTDIAVSRRLFTMPRGLVYFVNAGSYTNGQAGVEDDPGSMPNSDDVYYSMSEAILGTYRDAAGNPLLNTVPDQQLNGSRTWGYKKYEAPWPVSSQQLPSKAGDANPAGFPYNTIRTSNKDVWMEYTLGGLQPNASYKMYLGTLSHWHARKTTPTINGITLPVFNIDATSKVTEFENITATADGAITLHLDGASKDEPNIAFIAIQPTAEAEKIVAAPEAPTIDGTVEMGVNDITVGNVQAGSKIQVSLPNSPYAVIYEGIAETDGDYTVSFEEGALDGLFRLRVAAVTTGGASEFLDVYITDVQKLTVSPDVTDWTTGNVQVTVHAEAGSGLKKLRVEKGNFTYEFDLAGLACDYVYTVEENDTYRFTVYSNIDAYLTEELVVGNIDPTDVTLTLNMATTGFDDGKMHLNTVYAGVTQAVGWGIYVDGVALTTAEQLPASVTLENGRYTMRVESASGKVATQTVFVTEKPTYYTVATARVSGGVGYTVTGANGKTVGQIYAYALSGGTAQRLMASGNTFEEYSAADILLKVEFTDGTVEFTHVAYAAPAEQKSGCGCGSTVTSTLPYIAVAALCVCGIAVAVRRKKVKQ